MIGQRPSTAQRERHGCQTNNHAAMPAAAHNDPASEDTIRSHGYPDHFHPPMQDQQWHAVPDTAAPDRCTIYSDDERIVCQTNGTWTRGPREDERPHVAALIAAAPMVKAALIHAEKHLRDLIAADPYAGQGGMKSPHYEAWSYAKIALNDTIPA